MGDMSKMIQPLRKSGALPAFGKLFRGGLKFPQKDRPPAATTEAVSKTIGGVVTTDQKIAALEQQLLSIVLIAHDGKRLKSRHSRSVAQALP